MSLASEVSKIFYNYVFSPPKRSKAFRVLVIDEPSTTLLSSCMRMQDIMDTGITLVENITKLRKKMSMEAIYLIYPDKDSVERLVKDFQNQPTQYKCAYVYFMIACPGELLKLIVSSNCLKYCKALSQLNLGFLPLESQLYKIDCKDTAHLYTCPVERLPDRGIRLERLAEQLATVCVLLNEYPKVRYKKRAENLELARLIQMKLDQHKKENHSLGQGTRKNQSILLILDRGVDILTPFMHDLTLQPLIRDITNIKGNVYSYASGQEFELTDNDKLWKELRNEHIADVSKTLPTLVRQFAESKQNFLSSKKKATDLANLNRPISAEGKNESSFYNDLSLVNDGAIKPKDNSLRALQQMVREMPQYQREVSSYNAVVSIADTCLTACKSGLNTVCEVEQNLAMGKTAEGELINDPMQSVVEVLNTDSMSEVERFRLLMIFIISRSGISETHLDRLLDYARLSLTYKSVIAALSSIFGARLINTAGSSFDSPLLRDLRDISNLPPSFQYFLPSKGNRIDHDDNCFALSRWSPYLKDLLEKCISDDMDSLNFPFLLGANSSDLRGLGGSENSLRPPSVESGGGRGPSARYRAPSPIGSFNDSADKQDSYFHKKTASLNSNIVEELSSISDHCGPRLIVFIVGGITWSEAGIGYSVTQKCIETRLLDSDHQTPSIRSSKRSPVPSTSPKILQNGGGTGWNWEVILGGTDILTADLFVENLKYLADF